MNDLVTVIVPVYKVEDYLNRCVDSILGQTYHNLEVILVDDGSPDNCGKICDDYGNQDARIRVIHKKNGGLSSARNIALDEAKGDYILCVDSDDYIHIEMVERMLSSAKKEDVDIVTCSYYVESKEQLSIVDRIEDDIVSYNKMEALDKLIEDDFIRNYAWGKLYKRELFENVRYPDGRNYEDIATTYLLFDKALKIVKIPDYLYYYIVRDDSISYNNSMISWHKGCHASCLGQEERSEYLRNRGYKELYEKAMSKLLPYLFSDIKSAYGAGVIEDAEDSKSFIIQNKNEFLNNPYISSKDKGLIDIYLMSSGMFKIYDRIKHPFSKATKFLRKAKKTVVPNNKNIDFGLTNGKTKRMVYFELPCFDNLGDHAIAYSTEKLLESFAGKASDFQLFVISGWDTTVAIKSLKAVVGKDDVIICQGGGNFGSLYEFAQIFRRKVIEAFCDNKIVIMPQTVFYENNSRGAKELEKDKKVIQRAKDITIFARDAQSYQLFNSFFDAKVVMVHDVVTTCNVPLNSFDREGIVLCLRSDKEGKLTTEQKKNIISICESVGIPVKVTDTCTNYSIEDNDREKILLEKFAVWQRAKLVVTDRLHGMIFALITGTPCVVIGNNHHKVIETYNTIRDCGYIFYVDSEDEIKEKIKNCLDILEARRPKYLDDIDIYRGVFK